MLLVLICLFYALCLYAAASDAHRLIIPNWVNAGLLLSACLALVLSGFDLRTIGAHLLCGAIAFCAAYLLWHFNIIGGGDAKMMPGVLTWMGPGAAAFFSVSMALTGAIIVLLILLVRASVPFARVPALIRQPFETRQVPYGIAIAAGAFSSAPHAPLISTALPFLASV
jgi:prepilin peptidase CpaA